MWFECLRVRVRILMSMGVAFEWGCTPGVEVAQSESCTSCGISLAHFYLRVASLVTTLYILHMAKTRCAITSLTKPLCVHTHISLVHPWCFLNCAWRWAFFLFLWHLDRMWSPKHSDQCPLSSYNFAFDDNALLCVTHNVPFLFLRWPPPLIN